MRKITPPVNFSAPSLGPSSLGRSLGAGPRADWEEPVLPELQVYEPEDGPVDTGLLDAHGVKLYRRPTPRFPIGFLKR